MSSLGQNLASRLNHDNIFQLQLNQAASEGNVELLNNIMKRNNNFISQILLNSTIKTALTNKRLNIVNALITAYPDKVDEKIARQALILALKRGSSEYYANWLKLVPLEPIIQIIQMHAKHPAPLIRIVHSTRDPKDRSARIDFDPPLIDFDPPLSNGIKKRRQAEAGLSTSF